mgnify:CR=1
MYKQLTSEQRVQIFVLLQRKCPRKEIACSVGTSQSKLSCEVKRNWTHSGKYIGLKVHAKAMERRNNSPFNAQQSFIYIQSTLFFFSRSFIITEKIETVPKCWFDTVSTRF